MEVDVSHLAQRLIVGRKREGHGNYDPGAKRELNEFRRRPGMSGTRPVKNVGG